MKKCKTCGKEFMFTWPCNEKDYAWKRFAGTGNSYHYFCSYSCMKIYDNDKKKGAYGKIRKRVLCVELNTFSCVSEACKWMSLNGYVVTDAQMRRVIGDNGTAAGYHWRYEK